MPGKIADGEMAEFRFNSSGYRSDVEFGPKSPGTYRIVIIGSSIVLGARVPIEDTFATRLAEDLSLRTGRKIAIYNLGIAGAGGYPPIVALRFKDALAAKPDLILWVLTSWNIKNVSKLMPARSVGGGNPVTLGYILRRSRTNLMMHFIEYQSQSLYVSDYLRSGDDEVGHLRIEPSAEWKNRMLQFDSSDADIEGRVRAAGVPLVTAFVPLHGEAAMILMGKWPAGYDPYRLSNELRAIVTSHGGTYIDILPDVRSAPSLQQGYFPVEGHPNAKGHAIISSLLAKELTSGSVPALRTAHPSPVAQEQGR